MLPIFKMSQCPKIFEKISIILTRPNFENVPKSFENFLNIWGLCPQFSTSENFVEMSFKN